ncbi:SusD/RagB family nutrient-binding outer membrane lipoprotein [Gaetbulibacter aquiaggeris]|uniref:SusD/RagB family nutrient-binding outer membrane lipoprotein n=1 Tax=Gaetbulibacter aquiaggeris TaxID=1735373 RepID=A0ABW7MN90_9FLAO
MKNIKLILIAFLSLSLFIGCDNKFEEVNTDPNNPVAIPAHLLLGYAQRSHTNSIYSTFVGADMGACWSQQMAKVQYNDEERYVPRRGVIDGVWNNQYTLVASEGKAISDLAAIDGNQVLEGVGKVMQAIAFQTLADIFGPIPFTEALDPAILKPAYDDEATVWEGINQLLTDAASLISTGNGSIVATSDLYYGGDSSKWLKLANSLKFRALMRISSTRNVGSELQALINGGNLMTSNADSGQVYYLKAVPDANPLYETIVDGSRLEFKIGLVMVDLLEGLNDPRLQVYASPNASGNIVGKPVGYGNVIPLPNEDLGYTYANISGLGTKYLDPELPGVVMSYAQLCFLKAEAANEGYISGGLEAAQNYFSDGVKASFAFNGLDATSYLAQDGIGFTNQADGRNKIATQEYISLFGQGVESWTEWRRNKIPVLEPAAEGDIAQIPSRYYYPTTEPSLNGVNYSAAASTIGGDLLTSPLFWQ